MHFCRDADGSRLIVRPQEDAIASWRALHAPLKPWSAQNCTIKRLNSLLSRPGYEIRRGAAGIMLQSLDISTLRVCSILASTAFGLVFIGLWSHKRLSAHLLYWAASSFLYAAIILGFQAFASRSAIAGTAIFALMGLTNILLLAGIRSLDGRRAFAWWMAAPPLLAACGDAIPKLLSAASLWTDVGETIGLACAMGFSGVAILLDRGGNPLSRARMMAGVALLGYLPGYAGVLIGLLGFGPSYDLLAILPMLSDQLLLGISNLALLAMPIERAHALLRDAAQRDHLTGAWNRAGLAARVAPLCRQGAAIVAIDVDHFKAVNDQHGHGIGDEILVALVRRTATLASELGGAIARIGGDEFIAILPGASKTDAHAFAARLKLACSESTSLPDWTVSIGLAWIEPHTTDIGPALKRADASLYRAKALGRNRIAA
jgi:diguanylate cyclase (GGDEF)-like protein